MDFRSSGNRSVFVGILGLILFTVGILSRACWQKLYYKLLDQVGIYDIYNKPQFVTAVTIPQTLITFQL